MSLRLIPGYSVNIGGESLSPSNLTFCLSVIRLLNTGIQNHFSYILKHHRPWPPHKHQRCNGLSQCCSLFFMYLVCSTVDSLVASPFCYRRPHHPSAWVMRRKLIFSTPSRTMPSSESRDLCIDRCPHRIPGHRSERVEPSKIRSTKRSGLERPLATLLPLPACLELLGPRSPYLVTCCV